MGKRRNGRGKATCRIERENKERERRKERGREEERKEVKAHGREKRNEMEELRTKALILKVIMTFSTQEKFQN